MGSTLFAVCLIPAIAGVSYLALRSRVAARWVLASVILPFAVAAAFAELSLRPFTWVKAISLMVALVWLHGLRYGSLGDRAWGRFGMWLILALNILEAAATDVVSGNLVNAGCGFALVAVMPSWRTLRVAGPTRALEWPMRPSWVVAYTMWNFTFIYANYPDALSDHVAVLGVPLACLLLRPALWFQVRAYGLSVYVMTILVWHEALAMPWPESAVSPIAAAYPWISAGTVAATAAAVRARGTAWAGGLTRDSSRSRGGSAKRRGKKITFGGECTATCAAKPSTQGFR